MQRTRPALVVITLAIVAILIVGVVELNSRPEEPAKPAEPTKEQQTATPATPVEPLAVTPTENNGDDTSQANNSNLPSTGPEIIVAPLAISAVIGVALANNRAKKVLKQRQLSI